jgi:lysyl-tRNA synthetase class 2
MQENIGDRLHQNLVQRERIIRAVRRFFARRGYLEIETPIKLPAPAPEAHIDLMVCGDGYLQPSPELCMKRMLSDGYRRIFQICKCFREGERGCRHLPELTLLEWYTAGHDYRDMMGQCEQLIPFVASQLGCGDAITYQEVRIDLAPPWQRLSVREAFHTFAGTSPEDALRQNRFEELMVDRLEPALDHSRPVFLYDYPVACGSLARRKASDPRVAERFELYIGGLELCNAFSELADPAEQRRRFEAQQRLRRKLGKAAPPMPERFLEVLESMPAAAGNALGIDRLVMLLTDSGRIDDVVAFTPEKL